MEKAILKTLIYADIFDYPLNLREIHRWLIGRKTEPRKVERSLEKMYQGSSIEYKGEYYFLPKRRVIVGKRKGRQKQSYIYIRKVKVIGWFLKIVPWIKLVGISGGLAMENAGAGDDIDLFLVTAKGRLWISRLLILGILDILGQRRKKSDSRRAAAGKICCNIILEEDLLEQKRKDLYTAHEVLQMKVLWQRNGIYQKYLEDNSWAFKYLPNWIGEVSQKSKVKSQKYKSKVKSLDRLEFWVEKLQLNIMGNPKGLERISEGALYFHPEDYRERILKLYKEKIKNTN